MAHDRDSAWINVPVSPEVEQRLQALAEKWYEGNIEAMLKTWVLQRLEAAETVMRENPDGL